MIGQHVLEQRLDELHEVVDLLELAAAVLIQLAVAREDVQFLQQFDRLARLDFRGLLVDRGAIEGIDGTGAEISGCLKQRRPCAGRGPSLRLSDELGSPPARG
jgi:hypothetical protein